MIHSTHFPKLFTFLFIVELVFLTSCNNNQENLALKKESVSQTEFVRIDTATITHWNSFRQNKDSVIAFFKNAGNTFSLTRADSLTDSIYVYVGYDNKKNLVFYPIPSQADTVKNFMSLTQAILSKGPMTSLPITVAVDTTRPDAISLLEANARINNWKTGKIRDKWISDRFDSLDRSMAIFQIFVIKVVDMEVGKKHDFYMALREDSGAVGGYTADIIIVNTSNNLILQPKKLQLSETGNIEDVVHSVPPFKRINQSSFGLLKSLRIN